MQIYLVGGAVRDALLGLPVTDRDWVVVGGSPEALVEKGFAPVGKDFPVFLHPRTHEEFALARTERKTARGYHGFVVNAAPEVTLEEDLARRDLTINSIAAAAVIDWAAGTFDADLTQLTDPWGGQRDLGCKVLRHVTPAFREDPVRILRVARFAARFTDFSVAPETMDLMRAMTAGGEVDALVPERVWQELANGLMQAKPSRMLQVLADCGALQRLLPELHPVWEQNAKQLESDPNLLGSLAVRFAVLVFTLPVAPIGGLCERLRVPTACRDLAELVAREGSAMLASDRLDAPSVCDLLVRCDAFRKPQRFEAALLTCAVSAGASRFPARPRLLNALNVAQAVATNSIAAEAMKSGASGPQVGQMIHAARVAAVAAVLFTPTAPLH